MRVATWNVANRVGDAASRQGELLAGLDLTPDLVMLQEVNITSVERLVEAAGLDWLECAVRRRAAMPDDTPVRRRGVALAGCGRPPRHARLVTDVPLPERLLIADLTVDDRDITVASYHAPPGVSWHEKKPQQAVAFARWLAAVPGPALFGADANTPLVDALNFADTRTHWHTGDRHLHGAPGDDLLVGPDKLHRLDDAFRRWLAAHPEELAEIANARPNGPLAVTHYTGKRRTSPGTPRRFDSIWISPDFQVERIQHFYDEAIAAGSDHALVVADLSLVR